MKYLKNFKLFLITEANDEEILKLENEKRVLNDEFDKKMDDFLGEYADELEEAQGIKQALDVLRKVIKKKMGWLRHSSSLKAHYLV